MLLFFLTLAGFLAVGLIAARKVRDGSADDLIVAGRGLPQWLALLTMTATWVDGGYLLGTAEGVFKGNVALGVQGGVCFGISLVLGGLFFAKRMRRLGFHTLIDPFEARFGKHWAVVLFLPAMFAEVVWSGELLVAIGSSFDVLLGVKLTTAIVIAAAVVTLYTMVGGLWSVAYTDAVQLAIVAIGLVIAMPYVLSATGGFSTTIASYAATPRAPWTATSIANWWDVAVMLTLGGIPWNCYFQRVLSCRTVDDARKMSIHSGLLTALFVGPPLLIGIAAFRYTWPPDLLARVTANPSEVLPLMLRQTAPAWVGLLGLLAITGAVTSSFSASILSAASMFSWNCCKRLLRPGLDGESMKRLIRVVIAVLGAGALLMALKVQSVQALWFFTSDLVFVLLFPQLVAALFDPAANRAGSVVAFTVSLILRAGAGEPLLGIPAAIPYAEWFPVKTVAAAAGMLLLPVVSRLTVRQSRPRPLVNVCEAESVA